MKLDTSDRHVSSQCWKGFRGRKSKVKVLARPNALLRRRHTFLQCGVEAHLSLRSIVLAGCATGTLLYTTDQFQAGARRKGLPSRCSLSTTGHAWQRH